MELSEIRNPTYIQGLFRPLFSQLIHWFTKPRKYESPEAMCLLNALFDVACDGERESGQKREAAAYIGEFADWALRQAASGGKRSRTNSSSSSNSVRSILNRLYFLWRHPDGARRRGACLTFEQVRTGAGSVT